MQDYADLQLHIGTVGQIWLCNRATNRLSLVINTTTAT